MAAVQRERARLLYQPPPHRTRRSARGWDRAAREIGAGTAAATGELDPMCSRNVRCPAVPRSPCRGMPNLSQERRNYPQAERLLHHL